MIRRMWRGWTQKHNADTYDACLNDELFPRLNKDHCDHYDLSSFQWPPQAGLMPISELCAVVVVENAEDLIRGQ